LQYAEIGRPTVSARAKSLSGAFGTRRPSRIFTAGSFGGLSRALLILAFALVYSSHGIAQWNANEVHVLPRSTAVPPPSVTPTLHTNVDMVLVDVTVLDHAGRAVSGLASSSFTLLDDNRLQTVRYLSNADEPLSLVIVLDASASMAPRVEDERKALSQLVSTSNPQDDVSLIVVHDKPQEALRFQDSIDKFQEAINAIRADGQTALWDAMYLGLREPKDSRYPRKAMIVISDGGDNHSRYSESELRSLLKEADVQVYAVGLFNRYASRREEKVGPLQLDEVTSLTGGRVISVGNAAELSRAVTQISHELRNQYVLGYYPNHRSSDGGWRKITVQLAGSAAHQKFRLYARRGYYAPSE
jgi:Ca-activated chloride channel family protein